MALPGQSGATDSASERELSLRLYVAGSAPNSLRAVDNLKAMCEAHFSGRCTLEIVDVLKEPLRALNDEILVTPTLVKLSPGARTRVIGDLSDERKVLSALGASVDR
jgi:circadian clock protein KaiB